jgi:hypothetical protein
MSRTRPATLRTKSATASSPVSEQEEHRDDVPPPDPDDDRLEMDPSESSGPADVDWEESERSPHAGEEGQEPV